VPLPNTYDGFKLGSPSAPVLLEAFLDLLCPDCAAAFPTLQQVAAAYGPSRLQFILHVFPLPYHTYAFLGAQGAQVIKSVNGTDAAVFDFAAAMFNGAQQSFWNDATANMTSGQVATAYGALVAGLDVGVSAAAFAAGMADDDLNEDARISWKYACSRYTTGEAACAGLQTQTAATAVGSTRLFGIPSCARVKRAG
jgi:predicted DsbA family dithiol-disulfide isomerase